MKKLITALILFLASVGAALAQSFTMPPPAGVYVNGCVYNTTPPTLSNGQIGYVQCGPTGGFIAAPYNYQSAGASQPQLSVTTGAIVTPTVPAGTTYAVITVRSGAASAINYCDDGLTTTTTGATGSCAQLLAGQSQSWQGSALIANIRLIAATATTAVDIRYYK